MAYILRWAVKLQEECMGKKLTSGQDQDGLWCGM